MKKSGIKSSPLLPPGAAGKWLLLTGLISGLLFTGMNVLAGSFPFDFFPKALPIWILAILVLRESRPGRRGGLLIVTGLLFHSGGDVLLALGKFVPGLVSFLIGHLFFLYAWIQEFRYTAERAVVAFGLLGLSLEISLWMSPSLPPGLTVPVFVYVLVLSAMSGLSFLRSRDSILLPLGTILFIVSDTIIAVDRFKAPVPLAPLWVMGTYYAADAMIALGYLQERREDGFPGDANR